MPTPTRRKLAWVAAVVAAALAALWLVVVPEKVSQTAGLQQLLIRWCHPACWALLSLSAVLYALDAPRRLRDGAAIAAGACYLAFLAALTI